MEIKMCNLVEFESGKYVADIKHAYIVNIAQQAKKCSNINRVVLFGSAATTCCTERSDIDIAVFGSKKQNQYLRSKEFKSFQRNLLSFGNDFAQDYDILYFCETDTTDYSILDAIRDGVVIYQKEP